MTKSAWSELILPVALSRERERRLSVLLCWLASVTVASEATGSAESEK